MSERRNFRLMAVIGWSLVIASTQASGQEPPDPSAPAAPAREMANATTTTAPGPRPLRAGEWVRLTITDGRGGRITGRLAASGDVGSVVVRRSRKDSVIVQVADIRTLEVKRGGAGLAPVGVGAAAGLTWGLVTAIQETSQPCDANAFLGELCSLNQLAWVAVPLGAGLGGIVGWGVGELLFPARWRSVDSEGMKVRLTVLPVFDPASGHVEDASGWGLSVGVRLGS